MKESLKLFGIGLAGGMIPLALFIGLNTSNDVNNVDSYEAGTDRFAQRTACFSPTRCAAESSSTSLRAVSITEANFA